MFLYCIVMTIFKNIFKCTSSQTDDDCDDLKTSYTKLQLRIEKLQQDIMKLFSISNNIQNKIDILVMNIKLKN